MEKRIFKIDVGTIPSESVQEYMKNIADKMKIDLVKKWEESGYLDNIIETRYSKKTINPDFYCTMSILENVSKDDSGVIFAPYVLVEHTEESLKEYHKFMDKYKKKHAVCPKCGAAEHSTTIMGYVLNSDKKEEYRDLNNCVCSNCGDKHTTHDRISIKKFNIKNELL
jgi:superfamily II helicase